MKKILYFSAMLGLLWACDPMEDTYNKLDDLQEPYKENITYTLVELDYTTASNAALKDAVDAADSAKAKLVKTNLSFNERFTGADYIGYVLAKNFPALNKNSVAIVTYTYTPNAPTFLADLSTNNIISTADYQGVWGNPVAYVSAFTPAQTAASNIPALLNTKFPSATEGAMKFVEYNYSATEPASQVVDFKYFYDDFEGHTYLPSPYSPIFEFGWTQRDTSGTRTWLNRLYSSNHYAQATSSGGTAQQNDIFLITKQIDLTYAIAPQFTFDVNVGYWNGTCLQVLISEDYSGNVANIATASWTDITSNFTLPTTPTGAYGTLGSAGVADFTPYVGKKVYIAFRYSGNALAVPPVTTTYQVDNVKVSEMRTALSIPSSVKEYVVYTKQGSTWVVADNSYLALQPADYTAIGLEYISSANVPLYLPNLLKQKFPFALEGTVKTLVFRSSSTQTYSKASQYTLTGGAWVNSTFIYTNTDQFIHTGIKWIFDPTVHLNPSTQDYQLVVDKVKSEHPTYCNSYGDGEFYYGMSAKYKNIDLRLLNKGTPYDIPGFAELSTEAEKIALTWERAEEGLILMLQLKYTAAVPDISGIPVYYWVTFATYENSLAKNTYVGIFKCTQAGPDPVFARDKSLEDEAVLNQELTAAQVNWNR